MQAALEEACHDLIMPQPECVIYHPGFEACCLNPWALRNAWRDFKAHYGRTAYEGPVLKKYRHIAYRQFVRMVWVFLGRHIRVPLPACAVKKIRESFPDDQYTGFKLPDLH